jgi:hypothetical protein
MRCFALTRRAYRGILLTILTASVLAQPTGSSAHSFGKTPLDDVIEKAGNATRCTGLTKNELAAMMLAPTWPEAAGGSTEAPSPMTLSRFDTDIDLWSFRTIDQQRRAFWHPGVGMWQFDEAGLGASMTANQRINTSTAAQKAADTMASRYCNAGGKPAERRAFAWSPWFACGSSTCENLYQEHYCSASDTVCNVTTNGNVTRQGGMLTRNCRYGAGPATFTCWYVNYTNAQGVTTSWQQAPLDGESDGPSPLAFAFYVYLGSGDEWRHWLEEDTGYNVGEVFARRPNGQDSRAGLTWKDQKKLCDLDTRHGTCS